ncbi:MAG: hypothetical protein WBD64_01235 [Candidatus Zixiibacteriota bacterium]
MKPPKLLMLLILVLIASAIVGLCLRIFTEYRILDDIANLALVFTLVAVLFYVYYTYLLAKEAWTISASFSFKRGEGDPYRFAFILTNFSRHSLNCWCNLNVTVCGKSVPLGGFYGGESSFDLQPHAVGSGHFSIVDIAGKSGHSVGDMKRLAESGDPKQVLYMNVEFWYCPVGKNMVNRNARQPHYFDFNKDILIADF